MLDAPQGAARGQVPRFPDGAYQHAAPRHDAGILAMPLPQFVHRDFCQLRDAPNIPEFVAGKAAKLVLNGNHSLLEPDSRDWISMTVCGSDADRNNRLPLGFRQLVVVERNDDNSHTLSGTAKTFRFSCPGTSVLFP